MRKGRIKVSINGRFLDQKITGVQRYARELTLALDAMAPDLPEFHFRILMPRSTVCNLPLRNIAIEHVGYLGGHAWEQLNLSFASRDSILLCLGNTSPIFSYLIRRKVIVCVHDLSYLYFPAAYSFKFRTVYNILVPFALRYAAKVITVSEAERRSIVAHYPFVERRIAAIQNGGLSSNGIGRAGALPADVDAGRVQDGAARQELEGPSRPNVAERGSGRPAERPTTRYVLYVGSLSKRKNFPRMLEAAKDLAARKGYAFVFIGGTADGIKETQLDIAPELVEKIRFLGQVDDNDTLRSFYEGATVFMFPSLYEASPFPPIEAMGCGCAVVASSIPSIMERCGDAAMYCDPEDVSDIAAQIEAMMENHEMRNEYCERGLRRAAIFTWEKCARETLDVIAQVAR